MDGEPRWGLALPSGDYRILAQFVDNTLTVLVLRVGHRRDVY
ncbi:MAG: type II toxin-antitoxin system RelE family toxin [Jatrophihabitantaceae bacterium]